MAARAVSQSRLACLRTAAKILTSAVGVLLALHFATSVRHQYLTPPLSGVTVECTRVLSERSRA